MDGRFCERIVMINAGRIVAEGLPKEIIATACPEPGRRRLERRVYPADEEDNGVNPFRLQAIVRKEFYHLIRDYRSLYLPLPFRFC